MRDEAPEFAPGALEALREPLESGRVTVSRSAFHTTFPARVQLVMTANPCPCGAPPEGVDVGGAGTATTRLVAVCRCTPMQRRRYASRLSGPLLDRLDVAVLVDRVDRAALTAEAGTAESTDAVAARVEAARGRAASRWRGRTWRCNAETPARALRREAPPAAEALALLDDAVRRGGLSARGVHKVVRVAWSVADLRAAPVPDVGDVREALALRSGGSWIAA